MKTTEPDYRERIAGHQLRHNPSITITASWMDHARCVLCAISAQLQAHKEIGRVFLIAAKQAVENCYLPLLRHDSGFSWISYVPALGKQERKLRACSLGRQVILTNDESMEWMKGIRISTQDMIVIDDLSRYRRLRSLRYRQVKRMCERAGTVAAFSRLPLPHGMNEIWEELYLLDGGKRLGRTKQAFLDRYFFVNRIWTNGHTKTYLEPKQGAEQAIGNAVGDICLDLSNEDVCCNKEPVVRNIMVELSSGELSRYRLMARELALSVQGSRINAPDTSVVAGKLLQMASGSVYDEKKEVVRFHDRKVAALKQFVNENRGRNILVAYWFKHELDLIMDAIPYAKAICDKESAEQWNEGRIRVGLVNSAAGGTMYDLGNGGNILVWFSLTWSLQLYTRCCDRIRQKDEVNYRVIHLIAHDTIDEVVIKMLEAKRKDNRMLLDALKAG